MRKLRVLRKLWIQKCSSSDKKWHEERHSSVLVFRNKKEQNYRNRKEFRIRMYQLILFGNLITLARYQRNKRRVELQKKFTPTPRTIIFCGQTRDSTLIAAVKHNLCSRQYCFSFPHSARNCFPSYFIRLQNTIPLNAQIALSYL